MLKSTGNLDTASPLIFWSLYLHLQVSNNEMEDNQRFFLPRWVVSLTICLLGTPSHNKPRSNHMPSEEIKLIVESTISLFNSKTDVNDYPRLRFQCMLAGSDSIKAH
ncbi:Protein kinase-like domain-containing protein [Cynara cardunculus var. scolymus]|uniref:Protein kinase-like domain-containing protein n=1 Tax=Cynara cardunculus var. scolymus TaxID=59895 RepID=A0A118K273_CYNCS|nr:Protein kinase-like domain-containing protein [Cynara cardunculus var. scolymus]